MKEKIASLAIFANVVLAAGKITVGFFSNSAAVLAAGIDSFTDIFASAISYLGIKLSSKPADKTHPYGHYKFEVLSGVIVVLIVFSAGVGIIYHAYQKIINPTVLEISYLAIGIMIFSAIVNEIMARLKIHYGKKENSVSLLSDGVHSRIDVYTSLAILAGLFLVKYWVYADAAMALLMGLYIIKESFSVGKEAIGSLLDVSAGEELEEKIKEIAKAQNIEVDNIKTQKKGSATTANLEMMLPSNLSVEEATSTSERLREKLIKEIDSLQYVAIQIKSHEMETGFYKPGFGRSFGWQRKQKYKDKIKDASGQGPSGYCTCSQCGYQVAHERGIPCSSLKCPKCDINLQRKTL
jgi:cation diffusion facilitator family transporter